MENHDPGPASSQRRHSSHGSLDYVSRVSQQEAAEARLDRSRLLTPLQTDCRGLEHRSVAEYSPNLVDSPGTEPSDESMQNSGWGNPSQMPPLNLSSPENAAAASQAIASTTQHGIVSNDISLSARGQEQPVLTSLKRASSSELPRQSIGPRGKEQTAVRPLARNAPRRLHRRVPLTPHGPRTPNSHEMGTASTAGPTVYQDRLQKTVRNPVPRDSGYESLESRQNTLQQHDLQPATSKHPSTVPLELMQGQTVQRHNGFQLPANSRYPGLILQPDSCPISQEQLAAEVKGIYAGLVMVEAKCINMDATQAANPDSQLKPGQWQALIALHRTLLYEHHDFLMATQHPSASEALRGLAAKYSMPARMWKHGIHAFLEVLRHRRPDSQDYMLAFIYLAYQMMALLFETVPSFTDTWIECLGDLARYRMAIEEEKEPHATWGSVAARWYIMASDRSPAIGRLYHHLGILERPSLRKLCLYAKSLTCVVPFSNARDSLATLCGPIVQDEDAIRSSDHNMEARIVTFYALVFTRHHPSIVEKVSVDGLKLIRDQHNKLKDTAAYLAYTNVAALFEFGSPTNPLWQVYSYAIGQTIQSARVNDGPGDSTVTTLTLTATQMTPALSYGTSFCSNCFNALLHHGVAREYLVNVLPFAYVMLVFLHSLVTIRKKLLDCGVSLNTIRHVIEPTGFSWTGLAEYLNALAHHEPVHSRIPELARQGVFPAAPATQNARPLAEDYLIRGSMWCQFFFVPGWFHGQTEDDGRAIETPSMQKARAERVLWLGHFLASHTDYIHYDGRTRRFVAASRAPETSLMDEVPAPNQVHESIARNINQPLEKSSPAARSPKPESEDGFTIVERPSTAPPPDAVPKKSDTGSRQSKRGKQKLNNNIVKVFSEDDVYTDAEGCYRQYG